MMLERIAQEIRRKRLNVFSLCEYGAKTGYVTKRLQRWNEKNNVYSVGKTVVSLVTGIVAQQGLLDPEKMSVWELFSDRQPEMDPAWKQVLLSHVMTHTTGYGEGALDVDQEDPQTWNSQDYLGLALQQPLRYRPGNKMEYSDANYYILSRALTQRTGKTLQDLARELLFLPLGIYNATWEVCPQGYAIGASGLFLTVEDMAKLGVLMLQNGAWNGTQIVPQRWIFEMQKNRTASADGRGYGYGVWLRNDTQAFLACGMLGQLIFVSPQTGRVVACQSCENDEKMAPLLDFLVKADSDETI